MLVRILGVVVVIGLLAYGMGAGFIGPHSGPGTPFGEAVPEEMVQERYDEQDKAWAALRPQLDKQILFGDFHVHTTFSNDAFVMNLPLMQGTGVHPPADACDYARYCSALDFWSINDHAVSLDTRRWNETREAIRQCNAVADPDNPDVVAFLGYEWTQAANEASRHWGHKNVIFKDVEDAKTPPRPIYAKVDLGPENFNPPLHIRMQAPFASLLFAGDLITPLRHNRFMREMEAMRDCPEGVHTNELPADCREGAADPATLFRKLDEGGYDSIVIPHGNTWGLYTPPDASWDKQLEGDQYDPDRQFLVEVYSGHGNSEEYRDWDMRSQDENGEPLCPPISGNYLPDCQRAGQIIFERCTAAGAAREECEQRAEAARINFASTSRGERTVPGVTVEDWLASGQCPDCFLPSFGYRPNVSSQYALAISREEDGEQRRMRFGFIASSDNHSARPGTGYKEYARMDNTEAMGPVNTIVEREVGGEPEDPVPWSRPYAPTERIQHDMAPRWERANSFLYTGGLVASHSERRTRDGIWDSLQRKEVYGTSGDRILLWFDLLNGEEGKTLPMGSDSQQAEAPRFRVRAIGAFKQKPGCPDYAVNRLGEDRLERLCGNECYNPSGERKLVTRIEVVRIRPQLSRSEHPRDLIEDVWKTFDCPADSRGCMVEFEDPEFSELGRDMVYYVRAIEEPSEAVNGDPMRCEFDDQGRCIKVTPCHGDYKTPREENCMAMIEERAWSSPIFVDYAAEQVAEVAAGEEFGDP